MIDEHAKQEISRKLGPLVTPERIALLVCFLVVYGDSPIFTNFEFLSMEIGALLLTAVDNIKTARASTFLITTLIVFVISPIITHQIIKEITRISLKHSKPLYEKIKSEAQTISKSEKTITDLKIEAAENATQIRAEAQFIARSTSFMFATGLCFVVYLSGYSLIIPAAIIITGIIFCYKASVELIKVNYEKVQKFRLAAEFKDRVETQAE